MKSTSGPMGFFFQSKNSYVKLSQISDKKPQGIRDKAKLHKKLSKHIKS